MIRKRRATLTAAFVAAAILAAGCSGQSENANPSTGGARKIVNYDQMQQEYKNSVENLAWPHGYTPPSEVSGENPKGNYQEGFGDTRASQAYECAWAKQWLATYSSDSGKAKEALEALEKVPEMGYMSSERADDATRRFFKDYLDRAKLGDPSGFQEDVQANCPQ